MLGTCIQDLLLCYYSEPLNQQYAFHLYNCIRCCCVNELFIHVYYCYIQRVIMSNGTSNLSIMIAIFLLALFINIKFYVPLKMVLNASLLCQTCLCFMFCTARLIQFSVPIKLMLWCYSLQFLREYRQLCILCLLLSHAIPCYVLPVWYLNILLYFQVKE